MWKLLIAGVALLLVGKTDILTKITSATSVSSDFTNLITQLGSLVKFAGIILIAFAVIKYVVNPVLRG